MEPKLRFVSFFDHESVCPGDILRSKENKDINYVVIWVNADGEEWYCLEVGKNGALKDLVKYIGFEHIDEYSKSDLESIIY